MSKVMVLNDGETFTNVGGCQIVEVDESATTDDTEEYLNILNRENKNCSNAKILGGFDEDGVFWVGDPRVSSRKKKIELK